MESGMARTKYFWAERSSLFSMRILQVHSNSSRHVYLDSLAILSNSCMKSIISSSEYISGGFVSLHTLYVYELMNLLASYIMYIL